MMTSAAAAAVLMAAAVTAQQPEVLRGVVRDSIDLEPIAFAEVTAESPVGSGSVLRAATDRYGAFVIPGASTGAALLVRVEAAGYAPWTQEVEQLDDDGLRVLMARLPVRLEGIEITAQRAGDPLSAEPGRFRIDREMVRAQPVVLETDVLRAATMSPAASAPSDWMSMPFIRGGAAEGTPVFLDGVRLFNPFHVGGFMAALNAEAVRDVTLVTGSSSDVLSVGSLSGAIDVATRDGARDGFRSSGSIGLASARMTVEGPIGESVSYMLDGRRTYLDLATRGLKAMRVIKTAVPYSFGDLHGKVTKDFGGVRRLSVTGYWNTEGFDSRPGTGSAPETDSLLAQKAYRVTWNNAAVAAHYRDRLGESTIVDSWLGYSGFDGAYMVFANKSPDSDTSTVMQGRMGEFRAEVRAVHHAGSVTVEGGLQATRFEAAHRGAGGKDGVNERLLQPFDLAPPAFSSAAAHVSAKAALGRGLGAEAGLRTDLFLNVGSALSPFAELSYEAGPWSAWVSASRTHQALFSIRNDEVLDASYMAFDLLAPVDEGPLLRNTGFAAGLEVGAGGFVSRLEAYSRRMAGLRLPPLGPNPLESRLLMTRELRELGTADAKGLEASASWFGAASNVVASYRWAKVARTVAGRRYTPRFHRDHEGELAASWRRGVSLWSLRLAARTGQPFTEIVALLPSAGHRFSDVSSTVRYPGVLSLAGDYNEDRLPPHARLDVGWRGTWEVGWFGGGEVSPYASIANLLSLPNVTGAIAEPFREVRLYGLPNVAVPGDITVPGVEWSYSPQMPILPFFGVEFTF